MRELLCAAVSEESEVTDANQSFRQNVDQESAEKLFCGNSHDLLLAAAERVNEFETGGGII